MKAPYISVQLSTSGLPRVTFECGYSESQDILQDDMVYWLIGGDDAVQVVISVMWKLYPTPMTVWEDLEHKVGLLTIWFGVYIAVVPCAGRIRRATGSATQPPGAFRG